MSNKNKLGSKITTLREAHKLSREELSQRSGMELQTIVDLEEGTTAASLAPLIKITRALGVRLGTLMDDDETLGPIFMNADQVADGTTQTSLETVSDAGDLNFFSLAEGKTSRHMNPFIITCDPSGEADHKLSTHEGEEFLYGMEGRIEIEYGKETYVLNPGESIYYDSIVPHQVRAYKTEQAKFLAVVYTPL